MSFDYKKHKDHVGLKNREASQGGRDIGPLPKVAKPKRRKACRLDFRLFCETYFPEVFNLAWSDDHLTVIRIIQNAAIHGGLFAVAMPRGSGKTSLATVAAIWALLYGHRSFVVIIGASQDHATNILKNIRVDLESNDLLAADFPEVCYPIRKLEGETKRCIGQLQQGERTMIRWTEKELILPTVRKSVASGGVVKVAGITGSIRGMGVANPVTGRKMRPDFVLVDDPQDDESARSPKQVRDRLTIVNGAILGMAGPGKKIAGVMPCTVIAKDDLADQILDKKKCPEWQGQRTKMLPKLPTDTKAWEAYAEVMATGLREGRGMADATAYYIEHRGVLDEGAQASWAARHNPDEASAIQHAMNLKLRDEVSFWAEYQNEPMSLELETSLLVTPQQVTAKATEGLKRGVVPDSATKLVAFIDVQGSVLFYVVMAFGPDFTGHVVEYGAYPEQNRNYYFLREVYPKLSDAHAGLAAEAQIHKGLQVLSKRLLEKEWATQTLPPMRISRLLVDSGWQENVVSMFCKTSVVMIPSKGRGITADRKPMTEYTCKQGERQGWNWRVLPQPYHMEYDTNAWKTFVAQRVLSAAGESGNFSIYEDTPQRHKMFAEHVSAEYPTPTEGLGRIVNVWKPRPGRENHWLDGVIGCYVAAAEQGVLFVGHNPALGEVTRKRRRVVATF